MLRVALSFVFEWPEQINHLFLRCPNHTKLALISGNPAHPLSPQKIRECETQKEDGQKSSGACREAHSYSADNCNLRRTSRETNPQPSQLWRNTCLHASQHLHNTLNPSLFFLLAELQQANRTNKI